MKRFLSFSTTTLSAALWIGTAAFGQSGNELFQKALVTERTEGNLVEANRLYQQVLDRAGSDRALAAQSLVAMGQNYRKLGMVAEARAVFDRVLRDFAAQLASTSQARAALATLTSSDSLSPAARQIWTASTFAYGTVSQDGRYLSYTDILTGDLAVRDLIAGTSRRLTAKPGGWNAGQDHVEPSVVSPDGSRIAYTWNATRPEAAVRVISASGSEPGWGKSYPGTGDDTYLAPAAWMPDGASLLVYRNRKDRTSELAILNLSDGSLRTIASFGSSVWDHVSVSPDGRFVAYDMTPSGNVRDIYVRAIDGSGESAVVVNAANDHHPMWSPDGTRVLFVSDRVRNNSLWSVPVSAGKATGEAELLRSDLGTFLPLGITRSGAIYYTSGGYSSNIGGGLTNVYVSQLDENSNPVGVPVLATQQYFNSNAFPSWAPDGETLGYFSQRAPSGTAGAIVLVIRNMRTGTERVIQAGLELTNNQIAWFPDGKFVLVAGSQNGKPGLYRVSLESAKAEFIVPNGGARFVLSRDGKWMYYIKPGDGVQLMVRRDLPSGNEVELKRRPQNDRRPWTSLGLSPDGKELAYAIRDDSNQGGSIEAIPAEGGASRLITSFTRWIGGDPGAGLYWTPDGRYVMFAHGVPDQGDYIWRVAASGGEGENMRLGLDGLPQTHKVGQPSVSPTGRSIAYTTSDQSVSEVWALENALSSQVR